MKNIIVREYKIESKEIACNQEIVIAFLTDLHNQTEGAAGDHLLSMLDMYQPDLVLVGGDVLIGKKDYPIEPAIAFMEKLSRKYRVYYANGNHEARIEKHPEIYGDMGKRYEDALDNLPLTRLKNQEVKITIGNVPICIYGFDPEERFFHKGLREKGMQEALEKTFGMPEKEGVSILLAHNPRYQKEYLSWGATVTLCGHYHGGVMMLGKKCGVITPDFCLFSRKCGGMKRIGDSSMIVSAGLGEHTIPLRIHNPRELTIVRLIALYKNDKSL